MYSTYLNSFYALRGHGPKYRDAVYVYKYRGLLIPPCESAIPLDSGYMLRHTERRDSRSHGGSQLALREQSLTLSEREGERPTWNVTNIVLLPLYGSFSHFLFARSHLRNCWSREVDVNPSMIFRNRYVTDPFHRVPRDKSYSHNLDTKMSRFKRGIVCKIIFECK